ncbi:amidohydrolase family protein [Halioxenophilus aromaticivorans]|uniref:Amidohydrolase family protein n=1 Tax=Halioxenophilus aromaticivorans TaxID=1306992 RepID=A0AAV3U5A8_9ALTE
MITFPLRQLCLGVKHSALALALFTSNLSLADSTAIINARLYTATTADVSVGSVLFEDGIITEVSDQPLTADHVIDAEGKIVTPGFIGSLNHLGLLEVNAVSESDDSTVEEGDLSFSPVTAFNPESSAIPLARIGGVTRNIVTPGAGTKAFAGVAGNVDLTGDLTLPSSAASAAVVYLWGDQESSRARRLGKIRAALQDRRDNVAKSEADNASEAETAKKATEKEATQNTDNESNSQAGADKQPETKTEDAHSVVESVVERHLDELLAGTLPLLAFCDRPADILQLLALKEEFGLKLIIAGGDGAVAVKEQLAEAQVAVILDALNDLPKSFDNLHASLNNAATLHQAGVTVALAVLSDATHALYQLRFGAGNAIANGLPKDAALAAISQVPAQLFGIQAGSIEKGQSADLVLWENDPFDYTGKASTMWINGEEQSLETRADKLRDRYTQPSKLPPAYVK